MVTGGFVNVRILEGERILFNELESFGQGNNLGLTQDASEQKVT